MHFKPTQYTLLPNRKNSPLIHQYDHDLLQPNNIDLKTSFFLPEWWYGYIMCKAVPYLQAVAVSAAVNTQAVVALERYANMYPFHIEMKRLIWVCAELISFIWFFNGWLYAWYMLDMR